MKECGIRGLCFLARDLEARYFARSGCTTRRHSTLTQLIGFIANRPYPNLKHTDKRGEFFNYSSPVTATCEAIQHAGDRRALSLLFATSRF